MSQAIELTQTISFVSNSISQSPLQRGFLLISLALAWFALSSTARQAARSPTRLWPQRLMVWAAALLVIVLADVVHATLPDIPRGVAVLNTVGDKALRSGILGNSDVDMISLQESWTIIQPDATTYFWDHLDGNISTVALANKSVLLRIPSMGGSEFNTGNTPNWVFDLMGVSHVFTDATPGTTYSFFDDDSSITRCIPVFWQPVFLAKKKALIAMAGAHLTNKPALKIFVVSFANAISEDWNVPHDSTGSPSQLELWLNDPSDPIVPGAGYTTQKMIDSAIHVGDAAFRDGSVSGTILTSASATFTQADLGCVVTGFGYRRNTHIQSWISPTQVTLDRPLFKGRGTKFTIRTRKDGLIDVAMAAFPNQYISVSVAGNGPDLDAAAAGTAGEDPGTYLAKTIDEMAQSGYPGRYIVQRNNVTATIPLKAEAGDTAWILLAEAADAGDLTAGQALGACWKNTDYRMNGGSNCDHDNLDCDPTNPPCLDGCALDYGQILDKSADHLFTYSPSYYEIYPLDAGNQPAIVIQYIHNLLNP